MKVNQETAWGEIGFSERKRSEKGHAGVRKQSLHWVMLSSSGLLYSLYFRCFLFFQGLLGVFLWLPTSFFKVRPLLAIHVTLTKVSLGT